MDIEKNKTNAYKKNQKLEYLLSELNSLLGSIAIKNKPLTKNTKYPILFIVGTPRSGTTILTQWLASLDIFAYPTNFMSRFHKLPYIGSLIQEMIFNKEYQYKNELNIEISSTNFSSDIGKTTGALEPHEFWYFWRNYFQFPEIPVPNNEFIKHANFNGFESQISLIQHFYHKPFFLKSLIINWYIESFSKNIENAIFIYIKRDQIENVKSILKVREQYTGSNENWFSFKPCEYEAIKDKDKYIQVAGQVYFTNRTIENQLSKLPESQKIEIDYEVLCNNPAIVYKTLREKLEKYNIQLPKEYTGTAKFNSSKNKSGEEEKINEAFNYLKNN